MQKTFTDISKQLRSVFVAMSNGVFLFFSFLTALLEGKAIEAQLARNGCVYWMKNRNWTKNGKQPNASKFYVALSLLHERSSCRRRTVVVKCDRFTENLRCSERQRRTFVCLKKARERNNVKRKNRRTNTSERRSPIVEEGNARMLVNVHGWDLQLRSTVLDTYWWCKTDRWRSVVKYLHEWRSRNMRKVLSPNCTMEK